MSLYFLPERLPSVAFDVQKPRCAHVDLTDPTDVDIFLLMDDLFDVRQASPEARLVFDHASAQNLLGASVFWIRRAAALGGEEATISFWQTKRDGDKRGIVEVIDND